MAQISKCIICKKEFTLRHKIDFTFNTIKKEETPNMSNRKSIKRSLSSSEEDDELAKLTRNLRVKLPNLAVEGASDKDIIEEIITRYNTGKLDNDPGLKQLFDKIREKNNEKKEDTHTIMQMLIGVTSAIEEIKVNTSGKKAKTTLSEEKEEPTKEEKEAEFLADYDVKYLVESSSEDEEEDLCSDSEDEEILYNFDSESEDGPFNTSDEDEKEYQRKINELAEEGRYRTPCAEEEEVKQTDFFPKIESTSIYIVEEKTTVLDPLFTECMKSIDKCSNSMKEEERERAKLYDSEEWSTDNDCDSLDGQNYSDVYDNSDDDEEEEKEHIEDISYTITAMSEDILKQLEDYQQEVAEIILLKDSFSKLDEFNEKENTLHIAWIDKYKVETERINKLIEKRAFSKENKEEKKFYHELEDYMEILETYIEQNKGIPDFIRTYMLQVEAINAVLTEEEEEMMIEEYEVDPNVEAIIHLEDVMANKDTIEEIVKHYVNLRGAYIKVIFTVKEKFQKKWESLTQELANLTALENIRKDQDSTDLIIDKEKMKTLIQEVAQDFVGSQCKYFTDNAFEAIQVAAEAYLLEYLQNGNNNAIRCKRDYILPEDLKRPSSF
jgi:histone H3/H4